MDLTISAQRQLAERLRQFDEGFIFDRAISGAELGLVVRNSPVRQPLVSPILPGVGTFMLHGQPRAGKSLLVLELLMSIAGGAPPFGCGRFHVPSPAPVLYVSGDDDLGVVHKRLQYLAFAHGLGRIPRWFYVIRPLAFCLDQVRWVDQLIRDCVEHKIRCVVLDPLRRFTAGADQGPAELKPFADALHRIRMETQAVIGLIHHDVRPGTRTVRRRQDLPQLASGGGIFSIVDAPLHVRKIDETRVEVTPAEYKLSATPDRFRVRLQFADEYGGDALRLVDETIKRRQSGSTLQERILKLLAEEPAPSASYIAKRLEAGKGAVLRALKELQGAGVLQKIPYGTAHMWRLAK